MIVPLSLERINAVAPYPVQTRGKAGQHRFVTEGGAVIAVDFLPTDLLTSGTVYELIIVNLNNRKSPRDAKVKKTILAIIEEFFDKNASALLYICETSDGKQEMRGRLFTYWFDSYEYKLRFTMHSTTLKDEEGWINFATLIIRNDNPQLRQLVDEFVDTAELFRNQKPQNSLD